MVEAVVNYIAPMAVRPRFHADDQSRDILSLDPQRVEIADARTVTPAPTLERDGFVLVPHASAVSDFGDPAAADRVYQPEVRGLILALSGADDVVISSPSLLRFGERSPTSGKLHNSRPARFIHVDIDDATAAAFARAAAPGRAVRRYAHYNIWRSFSGAPQDVPLAVCDARSVAAEDLVEADAIFDRKGQPEWSFTALLLRHNPAHRWRYFSGMEPDEALVFKTNDSDPAQPHCIPHSAFDDPTAPPGTHPRSSIETRATAFWFD